MSRALLILGPKAVRERAAKWCMTAPAATRVTFEEPKRSSEANARMWATLTEIARQRPTLNGVRMTADLYKAVFMQALGMEMVMLPTLDGDGFFPLGHRTSRLSVGEFSNLLELINAWAAREGVTFGDPSENQETAS